MQASDRSGHAQAVLDGTVFLFGGRDITVDRYGVLTRYADTNYLRFDVLEGSGIGHDAPLVSIGPIVALDDTWFDRARKDYVDSGTKTWNIATNGGFTAVLKWRFTTGNSFACCSSIFNFGNGATPDNIMF